jgi:antitoxin component YwqK of YwqJK toxin-antitoxin module
VMNGMEETAVEMGDIIKKMGEHMPEGLFWLYILLPAFLAKPTLNDSTAVKAIFLFSFRNMGHYKFFLKISRKQRSGVTLMLKQRNSMKILYLALATLSFSQLNAQYYFNDMLGTLETNRLMRTFNENKVRMVNATGFDENGVKATDFAEVQEVKENGRGLKYSSRNGANFTTYYSRFDASGRLTSMMDSSSSISSLTEYQYDAQGRIRQVIHTVKDSANDFNQVEIHQWSFDAKGRPEKMWRTINNSDSMEIRIIPDEQGNPGEEKYFKKGVENGSVLYYYDDRNRLTDIVRYNTKFKRLLPDVMFEYDDQDRVIQKITTASNLHLGYLIWRYIYNEAGLKTKEALFNEQKKLTGKIEYSYVFGQ